AFYTIVHKLGGSVSAEHGIGLHTRPWLAYSRSPEELRLMRTLKRALDPGTILNPGKIIAGRALRQLFDIHESLRLMTAPARHRRQFIPPQRSGFTNGPINPASACIDQ